MTLQRAIAWSLAIHVGLTAGLSGLLVSSRKLRPDDVEPGRDLVLNLVDPAWVPDLARGAVAPAGGRAGAGGPTGASSDLDPEVAPAATADRPHEDERSPEATQPEVDASGPEGESAARTAIDTLAYSARATSSGGAEAPSLDIMAQHLGLDLDDLGDQARDRMFPVVYKYFLQQRPTPSSYRQLLRTYIDAHMGFPYPITPLLASNSDQRFLGVIEIAVAADGGLRLAELFLYDEIADPDGTLAAYYRRILEAAATRPFLPPAQAGLPAPHELTYKLVNPESR